MSEDNKKRNNKNKNKNNKSVEVGLKEEGRLLLGRSYELLGRARELDREVMRVTGEMDGYGDGGGVSWEVLDGLYGKIEELEREIMGVRGELEVMSRDYEELRGRVNRFYGREVMKEYGEVIGDNIFDEGTPPMNGGDGEDIDKSDDLGDDGNNDSSDNSSIMGRDVDWWKE